MLSTTLRKCLSSTKRRELQTGTLAAEAMEYSTGGMTLLTSQISTGKSHNLLICDINKRYRLKGEKETASELPGTLCGNDF